VAAPVAARVAAPVAARGLSRLALAARGGVDPYLTLGVDGTAAAAVIFACGGGKVADDSQETAVTAATAPYSTVLRHGARVRRADRVHRPLRERGVPSAHPAWRTR
jgi:hypothetical protein